MASCERCPRTGVRGDPRFQGSTKWALVATSRIRTAGDPGAHDCSDRLQPELVEIDPRCSENHLGPVAQLLGQPAPTAIFSRTRDPTIRFGVGGREHEQAPGGKYGDGVQVDRSGHETQLERSLAHRAYARAQVEKRGGSAFCHYVREQATRVAQLGVEKLLNRMCIGGNLRRRSQGNDGAGGERTSPSEPSVDQWSGGCSKIIGQIKQRFARRK